MDRSGREPADHNSREFHEDCTVRVWIGEGQGHWLNQVDRRSHRRFGRSMGAVARVGGPEYGCPVTGWSSTGLRVLLSAGPAQREASQGKHRRERDGPVAPRGDDRGEGVIGEPAISTSGSIVKVVNAEAFLKNQINREADGA